MAGDNYTFKLPTEKLKTELEEMRDRLARAEAALAEAQRDRCLDPDCPNCLRWAAWKRDWGHVLWLQCLTCKAKIGQPCRHAGAGVGGSHPPILKRPHRDRPWMEHPADDLV